MQKAISSGLWATDYTELREGNQADGPKDMLPVSQGLLEAYRVSEVPACPRRDQRDSENISGLAEPWALDKEATGYKDFSLEGGVWTGECQQQGTLWVIFAINMLWKKLSIPVQVIHIWDPSVFLGCLKQENQRWKEGDNYGSHFLYLKASCVPHVRAIHYRLNILGKIFITVGEILCQL